MTAADHANTVRRAAAMWATISAKHGAGSPEEREADKAFGAALDALQAQAETGEADAALASLVSGVLCDAGTIPVAETTDVKRLHDGLRALLAERDEAKRVSSERWKFARKVKDYAGSVEAEHDAAVRAAEQVETMLARKVAEQVIRAEVAEAELTKAITRNAEIAQMAEQAQAALREIAAANPASDPLTMKWWENIRAIARAALKEKP